MIFAEGRKSKAHSCEVLFKEHVENNRCQTNCHHGSSQHFELRRSNKRSNRGYKTAELNYFNVLFFKIILIAVTAVLMVPIKFC
jgi:hypothetical protein